MDTEQVTAPQLKRSRDERERELAEEAAKAHDRALHTLLETLNSKTLLKGALKQAVEEVDKLEQELLSARRRRQGITNELDRVKANIEVERVEFLTTFSLLCDRCTHNEETLTHLTPGEEPPEKSWWPAGAQKEATWNRIWHRCQRCQLTWLASDEEAKIYLGLNKDVVQRPPTGEAAPPPGNRLYGAS